MDWLMAEGLGALLDTVGPTIANPAENDRTDHNGTSLEPTH